MRKLLMVLGILVVLAASACTQKNEVDMASKELNTTKTVNSQVYLPVTGQTGYVNSSYVVTLTNGTDISPFKVGHKTLGWVTTGYKTIVTFDTSNIPANAEITYGNLWFAPANEEFQYLSEYMVIEFAGPNGFGYDGFSIGGYDYYAPASNGSLDKCSMNLAAGGYVLHVKLENGEQTLRDITPFINKGGKTQMRISIPVNPELKLIEAVFPTYTDDLGLYLAWE